MYITQPDVAQFFWVTDSSNNKHIDFLWHNFAEYPITDEEKDSNSRIMLLGKEQTLYNYSLVELYKQYQSMRVDSLMLLCTGLSAARWNGQRTWINTQNNTSNFNLNLCLTLPSEVCLNIWNLQERISVAITLALSDIHFERDKLAIAYPFHYTINSGKVAGHLVQKMDIDNDNSFIRIGIGVNTSEDDLPLLPDNDDLARHLYEEPASIEVSPNRWIMMSDYFRSAIQDSLVGETKHQEYLKLSSIKNWDYISIYADNGTTQFGERIDHGEFETIHPDGSIKIDNSILPPWNYHIKKWI